MELENTLSQVGCKAKSRGPVDSQRKHCDAALPTSLWRAMDDCLGTRYDRNSSWSRNTGVGGAEIESKWFPPLRNPKFPVLSGATANVQRVVTRIKYFDLGGFNPLESLQGKLALVM